jgi:predicted dehydrogenase
MQPINTAILSYGLSGRVFHAPFLQVHKGFTLYGVWERTKNLAREKYPSIKTYRTLDELLADESIELVVVNTPSSTHYEYSKKCLQAGKNVIVEKPFTATVEEGKELVQLSQERGKKLSVFQNRRYDSDFKVVKQIFEEGWLGEIVEAEFHFDRFVEQLSAKAHKETPGQGVGVLYDLGSHLIDQALHLFGMPAAVFADIRKLRPGSLVDDYFEILLYYKELRVRLHSSYYAREATPAYVLQGRKGSFIKTKSDIQEDALQAGAVPGSEDWGKEPASEQGFLHTEKNGEVIKKHIPSQQGNYLEYFDGIYKALRLQQPLKVTAEDGLNVIRIIEAAYQSHSGKKVIELP